MTGFGSGRVPVLTAEGADAGGHLVVELRATNHKYNEVRVNAARELAFLAGPCEARIRSRMERGAVDARITAEGETWSRPEIDLPRARALYASLASLAAELAPGSRVPVEAVLTLPDVFVSGVLAHKTELEAAAARAVDAAISDLVRMQEIEGASLAEDMSARLSRLLALAAQVAERQPEVLEARRARLLARTRELLADARRDGGESFSPLQLRIEQEIVLLADRYDTTEEKTRLASHVAQCLAALAPTAPVPAGKRLDFLLQEVSREVTTMGAKSEDAQIAQIVVEMKTEAAKLREQVQNIV